MILQKAKQALHKRPLLWGHIVYPSIKNSPPSYTNSLPFSPIKTKFYVWPRETNGNNYIFKCIIIKCKVCEMYRCHILQYYCKCYNFEDTEKWEFYCHLEHIPFLKISVK